MAQAFMKKMAATSACIVIGLTRRTSARCLATGTKTVPAKKERELPSEREVTKSVFMSQSTDIFTNLALEDWMYRNMDFSNHHVMMVWRNEPCVVIGRHQNPWLEANVPLLNEKEIALARRNSGGGTVYHDRGNLNITFFTPRERYDRKYNLELIKRALFREFGIKSIINERQDIIVRDKYKVSGTAAKLGRSTGYHHCTLLVNANKADLSKALAKRETNATPSTPSPVANLSELDRRVTVDALQTAVGYEFLRTPAMHLEDGGQNLISQQRGFQFVNPTDDWFPDLAMRFVESTHDLNAASYFRQEISIAIQGDKAASILGTMPHTGGLDCRLAELKNELTSWDWCFGRTPAFTVSRCFPVPAELLAPSKVYSATQELIITITVEKGLIDDVTLNIPPGLVESGFHGEASVITHLKGKRFTSEALNALQEAMLTRHIGGDIRKLDEKEQFVAKCFDQVVNTN